MKMKNKWALLLLLFSLFLAVKYPNVTDKELPNRISFEYVFRKSTQESVSFRNTRGLEYDFYRKTCPEAESVVRSRMEEIYSDHGDVSAALLRLFFHDCFIQGCDASVFLDDSKGNKSHLTERQASPSKTLKGFDEIAMIKEELEKACPGVVSCADTLALATRDAVLLAGGPYYPVFTGRRDSLRSYYQQAMDEIPKPDDRINQTLNLFSDRGLSINDTVSLLGGHSIGKISCQFIKNRLYNFSQTGQPDPTIAADFLIQMRNSCQGSNASELASFSSGAEFDTHYFGNLLKGRGVLYADQQLMADENTASVVRVYASHSTNFRKDFARAMVKMSYLNVLSGSQGQVRINCSFSLNSS